jgi:lysophospholipase L1-like esterase
LAKQNPSDHKFEVLNAGRAGQTASFLLKYLQNQWLQLKPDIVIVNLSSNDEAYGEDPQHFASVLEDFVYLSQKNNFQLVLVAEAISNEYKDKLTNHQIMQEIAQKHHIKFINMHEYLIDHLQEGIIWWDFVHPTSFGYQLIAQKLFDSLQNK